MQFQDKTFEALLTAMLARIPDDMLKIEGSIAYDALSPAALKLAELYENLNYVTEQMTVETASAPFLDRLTEQMGIWRKIATYAVRKASFYDENGNLMDVSIGDRFSIDAVNYIVEDRNDDGTFRVMAEEAGNIGNIPMGDMQSLQVVEGLERAILGEIITAGEDEETDDNLRQRFLRTLKMDTQDGNVAQYQEWLEEYTGVGRYKVTPCWNGPNTVKLCILNSQNERASDNLLAEVQNYFDPGSTGLGNGIAPIGAKVTVTTATDKIINVAATITLLPGYDIATVKSSMADALTSYLGSIAFNRNKIYYLSVAATILAVDGVDGIENLQINGSTANITLADEEIGKIGSLTITEG